MLQLSSPLDLNFSFLKTYYTNVANFNSRTFIDELNIHNNVFHQIYSFLFIKLNSSELNFVCP